METLDADDIVHELIPDPAERRRIAAEVFADPEKRRALEAKLHPQVLARFEAWLGEDVARGSWPVAREETNPEPRTPNHELRIAVIPLLFEVHWDKYFDIICCVVSSRAKQISRMTATRGMTQAEAEARLAAQMPVEEKARRSHYVIRNDGTADELRAEAQKFVDYLTTKPPNHLTT